MRTKAERWHAAYELANILSDDIQGLEKIRRWHLLVFLIITPAMWLAVFPLFIFGNAGILAATATALVMTAGLYNLFDRDYRRKVKIKFTQNMAEALNVRYEPAAAFRAGSITDHRIFPLYNKEETEDVFILKVADRKVEMQEVRLYGDNSENQSFLSYLKPVDRGLLIRIAARTKQPFHTIAFTRGFGGIAGHKAKYLRMSGYERVPFGNTLFSRYYHAVSEDAASAHEIFNPAFIEQLAVFRKKIHARSLIISIRDREVVFYARSGRNMFEPTHLILPMTPYSIHKVLEEMHALADMIEVLKINPYVGL